MRGLVFPEMDDGDSIAGDGKFQVSLINPKTPAHQVGYLGPFARVQSSLSAVKMCTPDDVHAQIIDEGSRPLDFDRLTESDLVGISAATPTAPRAYEIADKLHGMRKDIKIVMGGIHPTFLPDEALEHCDSVVQGDAEGVWGQVLNDARSGGLEDRYDGRECRPETWEIPPASPSACIPLHVSRGCPHSCDFCCVPTMAGRKQRRIPVGEVVEAIKRTPLHWPHIIPFYDDNLLKNPNKAMELCDALRPLGINWITMSSLDTADDEDILAALSDSGCRALLFGLESTNKDNLRSVGKKANLTRDYGQVIDRVHKHDISVIGSFIVGFDHDDKQSLQAMGDELDNMGIDMATFSVLTPFPGTKLFEQFEADGRLLHRDWEKYTGGNVVFQPKLMQPDELQNSFEEMRRHFFSPASILKRMGVARNKIATLILNVSAHRAFRESGPVANLKSTQI